MYQQLTDELGEPVFDRVEAAVTPEQKKRLSALSADDVKCTSLAGEKVTGILTKAPGNDAAGFSSGDVGASR